MDTNTHIGDTVRIRRPSRIVTDALGHNIWANSIEEADFELEPPEVATDPYNSLSLDDY
ncbi:MAG: hypothetical protein QNJ19_12120 [Woeseiaceae bacterium]|nr:hypothetical protein [Woeseiaceae bacterium]